MAGSIGMCIAMAGLAGLSAHAHNRTAAGCVLIFDFIATACFPIGLFLIPFMYASEIAPTRIRPQITAMSAGLNWSFNFLVAEVTPVAFASIGWRYYLVYLCTNALGFVVFYFLVPETKGRSLEDIDSIFTEARNLLDAPEVARRIQPGYAETRGISSTLKEDADRFDEAKD